MPLPPHQLCDFFFSLLNQRASIWDPLGLGLFFFLISPNPRFNFFDVAFLPLYSLKSISKCQLLRADTFQQFSMKSPKIDTEISQFLPITIVVLMEFFFNNFLVFQCNSLGPDKVKYNF